MTSRLTCMLIAESATLDRLVISMHWFFLSTALPGVIGLFLCRGGRQARGVAFVLGMLSAIAGACLLGWIIEGRSTAPTFYLTSGAPLLFGVAACVLSWPWRQPPGPPA